MPVRSSFEHAIHRRRIKPQNDRAACMWASRHKISDGVLPSIFFVGAKQLRNAIHRRRIKPQNDRAACMWASRHKNIRRRFAIDIFCRCSQLRNAIHRRRTKPQKDRASGVRASRQIETAFFAGSFCRCEAVLTKRFCAQTSRVPAAQYPLRS